MTKDELKLVGIFVAGRIAAKEMELGVSNVMKESVEQKNKRMLAATSDFIRWMYDINPSVLPSETRTMVEEILEEVKNYN